MFFGMRRLNVQRVLVRPRNTTKCQPIAWRGSYGHRCGYSTYSSKSDNQRSDLDPALTSRKFLYSDHLSAQPISLLRKALTGYLPPSLQTDEDDVSMYLGYQHLFFRPSLTPEMLCSDGTDTKFLPGPESVWKYRLWAGGSVQSLRPCPYLCISNSKAYLAESVSEINVISSKDRADKVFVTIERRVAIPDPSLTESRVETRLFSDHLEGRSTDVGLVETERICFIRDQPASLRDRRRVKPPSNPLYTHEMTPTRSLLFQFSALTYNAHSVHLDRELAQQDYGAEDLVVHGPLTMVLMLEFLRITLQRAAGLDSPNAGMRIVPKAITYTNLRVLYVDRPMRLCCKPSASKSDDVQGRNTQSWQVWIENGVQNYSSCAVKATVEVEQIRLDGFQSVNSHPSSTGI